ncbi:MAG TPA: M56 family metallopeptidase [Gemmatimonadales bacterium]|jgi:beta-lactamase regulating signal transducer with metallopeptidase domain|nr:M56 family metallopeptidase [Gemmatimonadales bacterium]
MNPFLGLFIKLTLLLLAAWGVAHAMRRHSAAARHIVWLLALGGTLLLPILTSVAPALPLRVLTETEPTILPGESQFGVAPGVGPAEELPELRARNRAVSTSAPSAAVPGVTAGEVGNVLLALWLLGTLLVAGTCALGHLGIARLLRRSLPLLDSDWSALSASIARQSGVRAPVRLFCSAAIGSPVVWGMRPIILLPAGAVSWPVERRRVVLAHELAHAARGDVLAQLLGCIACAIFWFHPLVWLAARRLRLESERACDDQVLLRGTPGADYAGHLLEVARHSSSLRLTGMVAIGMARPSHLEGRLLAVLDESRARQAPASRVKRAAWAGLLLLSFPLSALRTAPRLPVASPQLPALVSLNPMAAQSDSSFEREVAAAPGGVLVLELESGGGVLLRGWDEQAVRVSGRLAGPSWRDSRVALERTDRGARLRVWQQQRRGTTSTSHEFEIMVPRRFDVELNSAGGGVTIVGLEGSFHGQTGGGALIIERAAGQAELSTGGGDIRVSDSELRGTVSTGGGEVLLSGVRGGLRASSGSGPVITQEGGEVSRSLNKLRVEGDQIRVEKERAKDLERKKAEFSKDKTAEREKLVRNELEKRRQEKAKDEVRVEKERVKDKLQPGALRIEKAGGAILLDSAPDGASLRTGGGRIEVGESAGFVDASTGGGNIKIGQHAGSVRAGTGAGTVEVTLTDADGNEHSVEVESGSGSAVITLPAGFAGRFELETAYTRSFGRRTRIESDWELEREETTEWDDRVGSPRKYVRAGGQAGKGEGLIRVRIVNGDIAIRKGRL